MFSQGRPPRLHLQSIAWSPRELGAMHAEVKLKIKLLKLRIF